MRARRGGWAGMLLAGAVGVAGLGPVLWLTAAPAWAFTAPVKISERAGSDDKFDFAPNVITIDVDDKILWTNKSTKRHTVTSDAGSTRFDSGQIPAGGQWERRFTAPGTYSYHCEVHPDMVGRIEVGSVTTTTTAPPPTTAPPTTAPPTTTTTAPPITTTAPSTTTTTAPRPASGAVPPPAPPVPGSAAAPPQASSTSTSVPSTTTTTTAPPTTATSAPPAVPGDPEAAPPAPSPETTATTVAADTGDEMPSAAGPSARGGDDLDAGAVGMVAALVAVGLFATWTLIRVRPGRV